MLPKKYKLSKKQEIENLAKTGRRLTSVFFNVKYLPNNKDNERWLLVVSGKVHKKAVKRNKIRRRVREIIRKDFLGKMGQKDIMVVVKDKAIDSDFTGLRDDFIKLLDKLIK